jgi:hypothetical protein
VGRLTTVMAGKVLAHTFMRPGTVNPKVRPSSGWLWTYTIASGPRHFVAFDPPTAIRTAPIPPPVH